MLICNCPLLKDISFYTKCFSNHMSSSSNFFWLITLLNFKNFEIARLKMYSGNLSQIAQPNMLLLVLIVYENIEKKNGLNSNTN